MTFDTKTEALDAMEAARADWLASVRSFLSLAPFGDRMTVDDVRKVFPPPKDVDPRVMGCVFRAPHWQPVAFVNSGRKTCHKRPVRLFERVA